MGCCLTTTATAEHNSQTSSKRRDAPPALPFEEETVKEVLTETPVTSKKPSPFSSTPPKITGDNQQIPNPKQDFRAKNAVVQLTKNPVEETASEISSEMYSTYSASFSAATTTTIGAGTIDEEGEVTQKLKKPPPAKVVSRKQPTTYSGERATRKERGLRPPARRSAVLSTDKKPQFPSRRETTAQRHGNVVPSSVNRREPPARRSRSPALRREAGKPTKVTEGSPVRKSGNRLPLNVKENEGNAKLKKINDGGIVPEPELKPETCESLENPRVSLECFIFL